MKVCLDVQPAMVQRAGVGRYTKLLAQNLSRRMPDDELVLTYFDFRRAGRPFAAEGATWRPVRWCPGRAAQALWKRFGWPPFTTFAGPADLYHFPNFVVPPTGTGRTVVTIHDLAFLRHPESIEDRNLRYLQATVADTVRRADAIVTVSRFSAREIVDLLQAEEGRVHPIYHGISETFTRPDDTAIARVKTRYGLHKPYLLSVGTIEPRKNIPFLVEVFERLDAFDGELVLAGSAGWKYGPIFDRIRASSRARDIRRVDFVGDEHLPALYAGADVFVLTSVYEGFGFPPLEAMACGTPVVTSSGGSLAEVVGDAGVVLETWDLDDWQSAVMSVLTDSTRRSELVRRGKAHAAGFTWAATAAQTLELYRKVAA